MVAYQAASQPLGLEDPFQKLVQLVNNVPLVPPRLYSLPPQVPEQRLRTLQKAFIATLKDPHFLAKAE